jgi:hypothetical protein
MAFLRVLITRSPLEALFGCVVLILNGYFVGATIKSQSCPGVIVLRGSS